MNEDERERGNWDEWLLIRRLIRCLLTLVLFPSFLPGLLPIFDRGPPSYSLCPPWTRIDPTMHASWKDPRKRWNYHNRKIESIYRLLSIIPSWLIHSFFFFLFFSSYPNCCLHFDLVLFSFRRPQMIRFSSDCAWMRSITNIIWIIEAFTIIRPN